MLTVQWSEAPVVSPAAIAHPEKLNEPVRFMDAESRVKRVLEFAERHQVAASVVFRAAVLHGIAILESFEAQLGAKVKGVLA